MNDIDCDVMQSEGLAFKCVITTTKHGKVFLVEWLKYNQLFSLKRIERAHYEQNQINIIRNLYHFNIINVYKTFMREKYVYLLMDYCPLDIQRYIEQRGVLSESRFAEAAYSMLKSVSLMHSKRICHNNIRPSKFLLDKYGRVQISDFCNAAQYQENEESKFEHAQSVDSWSLGVTFYYMLTGRLITDLYFSEEEAMSKDFSHIKYPEVSKECIRLISSCLNNNEKARPSVDELLSSPLFNPFRPVKMSASKQTAFSANTSLRAIPVIVKPVLTKVVKTSI
ncbi:STE family protein kinase [Trichomonas vaginalis G3]|uniref:STE family protein kinase n=2 Tax=Trichomonas vaginalis (strain ATCC PRA-98 / G3) TaxID=412133 RepID=A2DAQ5_TRIV3|nr:STE family protein kinase [Trichomonas vaginalis G3]|eukprot:XP_001583544.1 STE family protein kinase [Trichomonas vaginalis G3]